MRTPVNFDKNVLEHPRCGIVKAETVGMSVMTNISDLRPIAVALNGKSVRFTDSEGVMYYATTRVANQILQKSATFVVCEVRQLLMQQPSGEEVAVQQNWLAVPSRF